VAGKGGAYPNFCRSEGTLLNLGSRRGISCVKLSLSSAIKLCSFSFPLRSRDPGKWPPLVVHHMQLSDGKTLSISSFQGARGIHLTRPFDSLVTPGSPLFIPNPCLVSYYLFSYWPRKNCVGPSTRSKDGLENRSASLEASLLALRWKLH
jgi:hypothetical protein